MDHNKTITFGSLFSGIGGIDLGLERAGMSCAWQVEIDEYAQKVLAKHWPHVARYGDIRECGKHNLTPVDLIAGGFPCQDISNAGKRAGIEGSRSGLWSEYYRIICELRPRYILVENVAALLTRGIDRVLGDLASIGYDAEWQVLSAAQFGAPHLRRRLFIVAYPNSTEWRQITQRRDESNGNDARWQEEASRLATLCTNEGERLVADPTSQGLSQWGHTKLSKDETQAGTGMEHQPERRSENVADTRCEHERRRVFGGYGAAHTRWTDNSTEWSHDRQQSQMGTSPIGGLRANWWRIEPDVGRMAPRVPARVDRLKGLGNAVVPQVAEYVGRCILERIGA